MNHGHALAEATCQYLTTLVHSFPSPIKSTASFQGQGILSYVTLNIAQML